VPHLRGYASPITPFFVFLLVQSKDAYKKIFRRPWGAPHQNHPIFPQSIKKCLEKKFLSPWGVHLHPLHPPWLCLWFRGLFGMNYVGEADLVSEAVNA